MRCTTSVKVRIIVYCSVLAQSRLTMRSTVLWYMTAAILVVTSLGEADSFSCSHSPMDSPYILTVGALERQSEQELVGSNFGDCVDMYAPGEDIPAPWIGESNVEQRSLTGSSASAAIVTGIAANLMATIRSQTLVYPSSGRTVYEEMMKHVEPGYYVMFLRNIILGSRQALRVRGMANHMMLEPHPSSNIECDIHRRPDIAQYSIDQLELMEQKAKRPKAFQKVKNNLAQHTRLKAEEFYAK